MPYTVLIVAAYYPAGAALRDLLVHHGPAQVTVRVTSHDTDALTTIEDESPAAVILFDDPHQIAADQLAQRLLATSARRPQVMALVASDRQAAIDHSGADLFTHVVTQPLKPSEIFAMLPK